MTEPTPQPSRSAAAGDSGTNPSLTHFGLTALGFVGFIVLVAWLGRPQVPGG
jgi:hypothetical protein